MAFQAPVIVKPGDIYWCEPDPADTVGSEIEKDRMWVVVSQSHLNRGNCVVAVPPTRNMTKGIAHLIAIPKDYLILDNQHPPNDSIALTDQIRCLDKTRFRRKAGRITDLGLSGIKTGLEYLVGI